MPLSKAQTDEIRLLIREEIAKAIAMNKTFCHKRIEISVGFQNYDVHLKEFNAKFFVTGSVYHEVIPSVNLAKAALAKCSELSVKDRRIHKDAIEAIVRIVCPCGSWVEIAKIKQEYKVL